MATESIQFDPRELLSLFEVHYWPNVGRIMTIHVPSGATAGGALITVLNIEGTLPNVLAVSAMVTAHAIADSGAFIPRGFVYVHKESGVFHESSTMARTPA